MSFEDAVYHAKPKQSVAEQAVDLLNQADRHVDHYNLQNNYLFDEQIQNLIHRAGVHAYIMGVMVHAKSREVTYEALRIRFGYTNDEIAVDIIGG